MQALSPPPPASLEEQAFRRLRQSLMEGQFAPGQKLSIRRIAAALGTSPMPARTALRRLAAEQAVDVLPNGTAVVPRLSRRTFGELSAIRAELELGKDDAEKKKLAVRLAAPILDGGQLDALAGIIGDGAAARAANDPEGMLRADRDFLFTLYRAAAAPMLLGMIEALWLRRGPLFREARWIILGRVPSGNRHGEMLDALRGGDAALAAAELKTEIEAATAYLLERMQFADDPAEEGGIEGLRPLGVEAGRRRA